MQAKAAGRSPEGVAKRSCVGSGRCAGFRVLPVFFARHHALARLVAKMMAGSPASILNNQKFELCARRRAKRAEHAQFKFPAATRPRPAAARA